MVKQISKVKHQISGQDYLVSTDASCLVVTCKLMDAATNVDDMMLNVAWYILFQK